MTGDVRTYPWNGDGADDLAIVVGPETKSVISDYAEPVRSDQQLAESGTADTYVGFKMVTGTTKSEVKI
jgi:hypothetical protein